MNQTIRARIHDSAVRRVTRIYASTLSDVFLEALQNSRRGGATRVRISITAPEGQIPDTGGTSMDASLDASISLNGSVHVVRCSRLSGLLMRQDTRRWPVWNTRTGSKIVPTGLKAPRPATGFPDPVSLTVCPYTSSDLLTSPTTSRRHLPPQAAANAEAQ